MAANKTSGVKYGVELWATGKYGSETCRNVYQEDHAVVFLKLTVLNKVDLEKCS